MLSKYMHMEHSSYLRHACTHIDSSCMQRCTHNIRPIDLANDALRQAVPMQAKPTCHREAHHITMPFNTVVAAASILTHTQRAAAHWTVPLLHIQLHTI